MAVSSNRSPSPVSSRPNPNSRASEINNPSRRSFSGSPFNKPSIVSNPRSFNPTTSANSPSDFGQRNSIDRNGSSFRDNEKENEKEQNFKMVKIRSPAVSNGSKNFMAPTISAASKITAASPRKKVLADKNEPLRMSAVSFSDGNALSSSLNLSDVIEDSDSKSEICSNQKRMEPLVDSNAMGLESPLIPKPSNSEEVIDSKVPSNSNGTESSDPNHVSGDLNARFKISPSPCPISAPLDADPSVPPYDPKTNYLSPRPQFLHYRPNPRVGVYLNKESFTFESLSDTETTEETESEDSPKESEVDSSVEMVKEEEENEPDTESEDPLKESEDDPSVEMVEEEEKEPDVSESHPISTQLPTKTVASKGVFKKHFCSRSKSISLLLIIVVACLSISLTDTPVINGIHVFKDQTSSKLNDSKFAKADFDRLAEKFRVWSAGSISYLTKLIQLPKEVEKLGVLQFYNLTSLQEVLFLDVHLMIEASSEIEKQNHETDELGPIREVEVEFGPLEEKGHTEIVADKSIVDVSEPQNPLEVEERVYPEKETDNEIQEVLSEEHEDPEPEVQVNLTLETEVTEEKKSEPEVMFIQEKSDISLQSNAKLEEQFSAVQPEVPEAKDIGETESIKAEETESIKAEEFFDNSRLIVTTNEITQRMETLDSTVNRSESKLSVHNILGISLLTLSLVVATVFVYAKQRKSAIPNSVIHVKELPIMKVISSAEWTDQGRSPSLNWPTEVDLGSEACPSEMSSFHSYSKRAGNHEAQSIEKKFRSSSSKRESLTSSSEFSMDSASYGSFTTYEIIHRKQGDEETVTPVRRSSRIRSQFTSP